MQGLVSCNRLDLCCSVYSCFKLNLCFVLPEQIPCSLYCPTPQTALCNVWNKPVSLPRVGESTCPHVTSLRQSQSTSTVTWERGEWVMWASYLEVPDICFHSLQWINRLREWRERRRGSHYGEPVPLSCHTHICQYIIFVHKSFCSLSGLLNKAVQSRRTKGSKTW